MNYDTAVFVQNIRQALSPLVFPSPAEDDSYMDLAAVSAIEEFDPQKACRQVPSPDPLVRALGLLLETMEKGPFDMTCLGINELFKKYLFLVTEENEEKCTQRFFDCIYQLFLTSLLESYPFTGLFWEYLCLTLATVSEYLIEKELIAAGQIFLKTVAIMGRYATQKYLPTCTIQHLMHNMEIWAREEGYLEFADCAKNHRFNLESL